MIKFYNTKMMSPDAGNVPTGPVKPDMPEKGTYARDKMMIDRSKEDPPEQPEAILISEATENVITYLESDHPVETEEPDSEKQIIYNHDYILEVTPSETALVRESKEMLDAAIRTSVAQSFEESEDPVTEPDDPGTSQNV